MAQDILDEGSLASVGGKDADLRGWVSKKSHVLVYSNSVFRFAQVLDEVRRWLDFSFVLVVGYIDKLVVIFEASIGSLKFLKALDMRQVSKVGVSPLVHGSDGRTSSACLVACTYGYP